MVSAPDASLLWTWFCILAGLALIPFWWRDAVLRDELKIDRRAEVSEAAVRE